MITSLSIECDQPEIYKQKFIREIYVNKKSQPLTAQDYAKLPGFLESFQIVDNETTAKQFGNAVSVPVVYHLAKSLLKMILAGCFRCRLHHNLLK